MAQLVKLFFAILFLVLALSACQNKTDNNVVKLEPTEKKKLTLGKVSNIIQLKTTEESLLGFVTKTFIDNDNDRIFVLSRFNIFIFNTEGKFITKLKKGKGPGEINMIVSFSVDSKNKRFYALDSGKTIFVFDYNGKMVKKQNLDEFYSMDIHIIDEDNVFLYCYYVGRKEKNFVGIYNFKENKVVQKFISADESPYSILSYGNANNFYLVEDRLFFSSSNIFGLFEFKKDTFQRIITYDLGDKAVPESFYNKYVEKRSRSRFGSDAKEKGYVPYVTKSFGYKNYYLSILYDENNSCYAINEKNRNKVYISNQISTYFNLPNLESLKFPCGIFDNQIVFACSPVDFFNENEALGSKTVEIDGRKIDVTYDSNPFLIVVK